MKLEGKVFIGCRDKVLPTDALNFLGKKLLILIITHMLDDRICKDNGYHMIFEGQLFTVPQNTLAIMPPGFMG